MLTCLRSFLASFAPCAVLPMETPGFKAGHSIPAATSRPPTAPPTADTPATRKSLALAAGNVNGVSPAVAATPGMFGGPAGRASGRPSPLVVPGGEGSSVPGTDPSATPGSRAASLTPNAAAIRTPKVVADRAGRKTPLSLRSGPSKPGPHADADAVADKRAAARSAAVRAALAETDDVLQLQMEQTRGADMPGAVDSMNVDGDEENMPQPKARKAAAKGRKPAAKRTKAKKPVPESPVASEPGSAEPRRSVRKRALA
jgi:hypothetical protein